MHCALVSCKDRFSLFNIPFPVSVTHLYWNNATYTRQKGSTCAANCDIILETLEISRSDIFGFVFSTISFILQKQITRRKNLQDLICCRLWCCLSDINTTRKFQQALPDCSMLSWKPRCLRGHSSYCALRWHQLLEYPCQYLQKKFVQTFICKFTISVTNQAVGGRMLVHLWWINCDVQLEMRSPIGTCMWTLFMVQLPNLHWKS